MFYKYTILSANPYSRTYLSRMRLFLRNSLTKHYVSFFTMFRVHLAIFFASLFPSNIVERPLANTLSSARTLVRV